MVQVRVNTSHLAIDLDGDGISTIFNKGAVFDCPVDRAAKLGNSVTIVEIPVVVPELPIVPEISEPIKKPSSRRNRR